MRDTKTVSKFLRRHDIYAGYKPQFKDYIGYSNATRELESQPLRPDEFEREKKRLAERYGI